MTSLLILRHEEALPGHAEGDALRELSPRGRARMHAQARTLFDALPGLDRVVCSPLVRATQTAEILVSAFDFDTPVHATRAVSEPRGMEQLLAALSALSAPIGVVALVGHEPTVSGFVEHLTGTASLGFRPGEANLLSPAGSAWAIRGRWHGGDAVPESPVPT